MNKYKSEKELHIHKFKYVGSGTGFGKRGEPTYSDVGYKCECGKGFTMLLPTSVYLQRKYPEQFMTESF